MEAVLPDVSELVGLRGGTELVLRIMGLSDQKEVLLFFDLERPGQIAVHSLFRDQRSNLNNITNGQNSQRNTIEAEQQFFAVTIFPGAATEH